MQLLWWRLKHPGSPIEKRSDKVWRSRAFWQGKPSYGLYVTAIRIMSRHHRHIDGICMAISVKAMMKYSYITHLVTALVVTFTIDSYLQKMLGKFQFLQDWFGKMHCVTSSMINTKQTTFLINLLHPPKFGTVYFLPGLQKRFKSGSAWE